MQSGYILPKKAIIVAVMIISLVGVSAFRLDMNKQPPVSPEQTRMAKDSAESIEAFGEVYKVLMSPRCMNCHPAGDVPLQGDDSHLHQMLPKRGKDGKGVYAMKCSNCHQPTNTPGLNTPPGNPKWALPPAEMKMVFEGKNARELALQIMDFKQNGHKDKAKLIEHARDTLVKAGWNMGEGRKPPPLSYQEFVIAWDTWINTGGLAPAN
jgi:mono/diheme cytochrome c family protein